MIALYLPRYVWQKLSGRYMDSVKSLMNKKVKPILFYFYFYMYPKVPSSTLVYYSILSSFGQRSQYIQYTVMCIIDHCLAYFLDDGYEGRRGPLPLAFQYLIVIIWRPCDFNLVMISSVASKWQHFKLGGLQFHFIKWLKNRHPNFKVLAFWRHWRYHDQI